MKKRISMILCILFLVSLVSTQAFAEASADITEVSLGDILAVEDLMDFTIKSISFSKSEKYYGKDGVNYSTYAAGGEYRFLLVNCVLLNVSLDYYTYDSHISNVKIVYRDKYEYEPVYLQNARGKKLLTQKLWEVEALVSITPVFLFKVPKIIEETSLESIYLYFTLDNADYVCKIR